MRLSGISLHTGHMWYLCCGENSPQNKATLIDQDKHNVLKAAHPSPLSAYNGFFGCGHFSKTNNWLREHGEKPIDWSI